MSHSCYRDLVKHMLNLYHGDLRSAPKSVLPAPTPSLPSTTPIPQLLTHLTYKEPVKLALARDFPLVVRKLEITERGIAKMTAESEASDDHGPLHQGLGWLHYRTFFFLFMIVYGAI